MQSTLIVVARNDQKISVSRNFRSRKAPVTATLQSGNIKVEAKGTFRVICDNEPAVV